MHGQTIMPLIINTHGHLGMVKGTSSGVSNQTRITFVINFFVIRITESVRCYQWALTGRSSPKSAKPLEVVSGRGQTFTPPAMVVGHRDGRTSGGHVIKAVVCPTLEVFVTVNPVPLEKKDDPETGLTLIAPDSK